MKPAVVLTLAIAAASAVPRPEDTPVTSAALSVVERTTKRLNVTIVNNRESPLVEWRVDSTWASFGGRGTVPPHEQRTFSYDVDGDRPATRPAKMEMAVFEDGYYEGYGRRFDEWIAERNERRADLDYWVRAFMSMPRISHVEVRRVLTEHIVERAGQGKLSIRYVAERAQQVLRQYPEGPDLWPALDDLRRQVEAEFIAASRAAATPKGRVEAVTAASIVSVEDVPSTSYSVVVENLRDVPIEALGVDSVEASGRRIGNWGTDFCMGDPAFVRPGTGRIQPHERRAFPQMGPPDKTMARVLSYVIFDDLKVEGRAAAWGDALRNREERAVAHALSIDALKEAASRSPDTIEAFLMTKKADVARQLQQQGKPVGAPTPLDEALRQVRESPSRFLAHADAYRASVEQQLVRLRRHLSRQ